MRLKIDRDYRRSRELAPYLCWDGDMPRPVMLTVDMTNGEAFLATLPDGGVCLPEGLKTFPVDPCLTVNGIDQLFAFPGVEDALQGVLDGDKESEAFLWEMASSGLYERLEGLQPMEPWEYAQSHPLEVNEGESIEEAAERIVAEALEDLVYLRAIDVECHLEDESDEGLEDEE
jgi:hypothetical protein